MFGFISKDAAAAKSAAVDAAIERQAGERERRAQELAAGNRRANAMELGRAYRGAVHARPAESAPPRLRVVR